ncbi:Intraflagellar transport protein 46 [Polyplax serrata]|uniref:Intraflagellar transport protein 46 homolog n=1 Tax=Polyplax serrata TaxID=468196 RepID=A0ABR1AGJ6_POLSC
MQSTNWGHWRDKNDLALLGQLSDNTENSDNDDDDDDDDEDDDDNDVRAPFIQGAYDPNDYEQLAVSEEIKDIFNYVTKYTPQNIELDNKLCPFLPDFIPAVGDIDAFVKVSRPDGQKDGLGLTVLDEPRLQQSDPAVLQLQLRAVDKQTSARAIVKKIENAEKNAKSIDRWIKAISDLHSSKPSAQTFQYTRPMPIIDNLMQEWPFEMEEKLSGTPIPCPDLDCDLSTYITIICSKYLTQTQN